jgi:hypothetical protein
VPLRRVLAATSSREPGVLTCARLETAARQGTPEDVAQRTSPAGSPCALSSGGPNHEGAAPLVSSCHPKRVATPPSSRQASTSMAIPPLLLQPLARHGKLHSTQTLGAESGCGTHFMRPHKPSPSCPSNAPPGLSSQHLQTLPTPA